MAATNTSSSPSTTQGGRSLETVRREIETERERLASAVEDLRRGPRRGDRRRREAPRQAARRDSRRPGSRLLPRRGDRRDHALLRSQGSRALTRVGTAPSNPYRLPRSRWVEVFKRSFKEFLNDDCMGLSQQIAFSSLLAFFPAVVFLVGLLDLVGAYPTLKEFLAPIAPGDVAGDGRHAPAGDVDGHVGARLLDRARRRHLGRERRDGLGAEGGQPRVRARGDTAGLEDEDHRGRARVPDRNRDRGTAAPDRLRRAARERDRRAGAARRSLRPRLVDPPLADRVRRDPPLLLDRLLPGAERRHPQLAVALARGARRRALLARASPASSRSTRASRTPTRRRTARSRAASCSSSG